MNEASFRYLDAVHIDDDREYVEFRFRDPAGEQQTIQIGFEYVESLAAAFQQVFNSAMLEMQQGGNRQIGNEWLSVPRADVDHPVSVGVDIMRGRVVAMYLLGSPFQMSYALPAPIARALAHDLLMACDEVQNQDDAAAQRPPN